MSDDLGRLAPTDPSLVDPEWTDARRRILEDVTSRPTGSGPLRWVAAAAVAAALVAIAVGAVWLATRGPLATPVPPADTPSATSGTPVPSDLYRSPGTIIGADGVDRLCSGVLESMPPQCVDDGLVLEGLDWSTVPGAQEASGVRWSGIVVVEGILEGDVLTVTAVHNPDDLGEGPTSPPATEPAEWIPFELYTHCGIHELIHDGLFYAREGGPLDDGNGNPPDGWDNPVMNGRILVDGNRVIYEDDAGHHEVFLLREGATEPLVVCA